MEIGLAVGGAFLSSALNVLFDRLSPDGDLLNMFRKHKDHVKLLKKLKMTLRGLQIVLSDAENKQASNPSMSDCLNELRDAVDSAENILEEVNYEALRLKVEGQHQNLAETSNQQVSHLSLSLSDEFFLNIKDKLEENIETSEELQKQIGWLDLKAHLESGKQETRRPSTSVVDESDIFGMQSETKELLQEFGLKVDNNLNQLQVKLKESFKGKKFLIVLDDVWNENYKEWDDLRNLFVQGDVGSKIIVTTRKESVASMMGCGAINVGTLSSEVSWDLFKRHSLENMDPEEHPELEEVGIQIAHKCKGLPLALKALAGILRSKSKVDEWRDILRSKIWELQSCSNGILPALMLSYNDLCPDSFYSDKIDNFKMP
ncbi:putative disease resistance RPP13-like protein 1 [Solanum pennellii]|uniref:Disease resistance RPP13-like protein 1 n=1 Tax=Solanum pennellii TaxID=28526 RepID=A0ABM1UYJ1_SOLPN|nr:putative disease resistance RPP13-like protein 1 [Solanum pennellii]